MSEATALLYSDSYQQYDFSPWHPMKPARLLLTAALIDDYGITSRDDCRIIEPRAATVDELGMVHDPGYIAKVIEVSEPGAGEEYAHGYGLGTGDNPVFPGMHEASATIAGASLQGAEAVISGELDHAFNVAGGLHHALRSRASGFCIYNDPAIAIAWLRREHGARVVYIDVDAHHGDGVQEAFYSDPEVMTVSFHESGRSLFPGTGFTSESGRGEAEGTSVNLPLAPFTTDELVLEAWDATVPHLVKAFEPQVIVTQCGCDGHWEDPLTHLSYSLDGFSQLWRRMHDLAHEVTDGRWLATGGGGYQAYTVVPRAWTLLMAEIAGAQPQDELPDGWRELCERHSGSPAPASLRQDRPPPADADTIAIARETMLRGVADLRERIFPVWGI